AVYSAGALDMSWREWQENLQMLKGPNRLNCGKTRLRGDDVLVGNAPAPCGRATQRLARLYLDIKESLIEAGFAKEIDWQYDLSIKRLTESQFLRESAWVILSSGFRETVLRLKFHAISDAFLSW